MSDRFKFRAWLIDEKRYGENINLFNCCNDTTYDVEEYDDKGSHYTMYGADEVILEQCTGLKDKNGKLIYEGDIVEVSEAYENGIYKIEFCQSDCEYNLYNKEGNFIYQLTKSMARYMKVIGNIHENKELLDE